MGDHTASPALGLPLAARPPASSLRRRWFRALALLVAIVVAGALADRAGTRLTVDAFRSAAVQLEKDAEVLARLRADVVAAALLRSAAVQGLTADLAPLAAASEAERASFEEAIRVLRPGGGREIVERQYARAKEFLPADITTLTPAEFAARTAAAQENFALIDDAAAASRTQASVDLDRAASLERSTTLATVLLGFLVVGLVARFARRLSVEVLRPVAELRGSAARLAAGDLDHRVDLDRNDEFGDLAATFNAMADAVAGTHRALTFQANHDPLTGLANRSAFHARLETALAQPDRRDSTQAVLFVDLDDFKDVNDLLGHAVGDVVLRAAAERLLATVRPGDLVARLGGDEFAVLVEVADDAAAAGIAERAVESLAAPLDMAGTRVHVGASIGLALRRHDSVADTLMREADIAMYAAKALGKNRVQRYSPETTPPGATVGEGPATAGPPAA